VLHQPCHPSYFTHLLYNRNSPSAGLHQLYLQPHFSYRRHCLEVNVPKGPAHCTLSILGRYPVAPCSTQHATNTVINAESWLLIPSLGPPIPSTPHLRGTTAPEQLLNNKKLPNSTSSTGIQSFKAAIDTFSTTRNIADQFKLSRLSSTYNFHIRSNLLP
jgi:hypothetical protein